MLRAKTTRRWPKKCAFGWWRNSRNEFPPAFTRFVG